MGPETNYSHMRQLLRPGERGLFIFTRGDGFQINGKDNSGYTGWWKVNKRRRADFIFIYYRLRRGMTELYMARRDKLENPTTDGRSRIKLSDIKLVGYTNANWVKFGGGARNPIRYVS